MSVNTTSRLLIILKTLGAIIETEIEEKFNPDFVNKCDVVEVIPVMKFDAARYLGLWYETAHVKEFDVFQPGDSACIEAVYTDLGTGNGEFEVVNSYQRGVSE
jgi:lipocalin